MKHRNKTETDKYEEYYQLVKNISSQKNPSLTFVKAIWEYSKGGSRFNRGCIHVINGYNGASRIWPEKFRHPDKSPFNKKPKPLKLNKI